MKFVKSNGEKATFGTMFLREIIGKFISSLFFGLGYFWAIWDKDRQAWHDKIAGTYVLETKMKKLAIIILALLIFAISATPTYARSGCCSHHGGVSGCAAPTAPPSPKPAPPTTHNAPPEPPKQPIYVAPTSKPYVPPVRTVKHVYPQQNQQ